METLRKIYKNRRKRLGENSKERPEGVCIIIYCYSREECDTVAQQFKKDGINAASYHAGMSSKNRDLILEKWSKTTSFTKREEALDVIVATISFGMGNSIDKFKNINKNIYYENKSIFFFFFFYKITIK